MLILFLLCYILFTREPPDLRDQTALREEKKSEEREPRLGDGCYHAFLDVGANVGVHGRFLMEPEKYPNSRSSVALFKQEYPGLDNRDVCVFAFEANPKHWPRLREVSEAYAAVGWRYHVVEAAVSDKAGTTKFYHQGKWDEENSEWGFSGAKDLSNIYGEQRSVGKYVEEVKTIRLSDWIKTHIYERLVPDVPPSREGDSSGEGAAPPRPILSMKMDIEGYEYVVVPDLIHTGMTCGFSFIFGEFHPGFAPVVEFRKEPSETDGDFVSFHRVKLESKDELNHYGGSLVQVMEASRNCQVRFLWSDDESYLHDGQPLPVPTTSS